MTDQVKSAVTVINLDTMQSTGNYTNSTGAFEIDGDTYVLIKAKELRSDGW